jgi:hypothetical protein
LASGLRLTFARFTIETPRAGALAARGDHRMGDIASMLAGVDRVCGQFATALHNSELQIYTTLVLLLVLGVLLFPPKNDPDQI